MTDETFLARWLRRKRESAAGPDRATVDAVPVPTGTQSTSPAGPDRQTADVVPAQAGTQSPEPLPPVESLTPESDFTPFMKPEVDAGTKRQAMKALFRDPQFNVMDRLDVYIDDYSKPDPLPEGWLEKLEQVKRLGIFREPEESAAREPATPPETLQKPAEEQPIAPPEPPGSPDTSGAGIPASGVRESH
jgi:hypothetical protein